MRRRLLRGRAGAGADVGTGRGANHVALPLTLMLGVALLTGSWVIGNPPLEGPDEWSHYLRALDLTNLRLVGEPVATHESAGLTPRQADWVRHLVRRVEVPSGLNPHGWDCHFRDATRSAGCIAGRRASPGTRLITAVGNYTPTFYLLPGVAARLAPHPPLANWLGRTVSAATCLLLLTGAAWALWERAAHRAVLLGMVAALTPMTLYSMSLLNPSGPEVAGAVATAAALIRIARDPAGGLAWALLAAGGATLVLSRSVGYVWLLGLLAVWLLWSGARAVRDALRLRPRRSVAVAGVLLAALAAQIAFEAAYGPPTPLRLTDDPPAFAEQWRLLRDVLGHQAVGQFGYMTWRLPVWLYRAWWLVWAAALVGAMALGRGRRRRVAGLVLLAVPAAAVALDLFLLRNTGFLVQGRHVLPLVAVVPLFAVEAAAPRVARLSRRWVLVGGVGVGLLAAACQFVAWYANARRMAVGIDGPRWFLPSAEWGPPLGWWPWLVMAALGSICLFAACAWIATSSFAVEPATDDAASAGVAS